MNSTNLSLEECGEETSQPLGNGHWKGRRRPSANRSAVFACSSGAECRATCSAAVPIVSVPVEGGPVTAAVVVAGRVRTDAAPTVRRMVPIIVINISSGGGHYRERASACMRIPEMQLTKYGQRLEVMSNTHTQYEL